MESYDADVMMISNNKRSMNMNAANPSFITTNNDINNNLIEYITEWPLILSIRNGDAM